MKVRNFLLSLRHGRVESQADVLPACGNAHLGRLSDGLKILTATLRTSTGTSTVLVTPQGTED